MWEMFATIQFKILSSHILSKYLIKVVQHFNCQVHYVVMKLCLPVRGKAQFRVFENEVLRMDELTCKSVALYFVFFA
jgi:hypothetical protein